MVLKTMNHPEPLYFTRVLTCALRRCVAVGAVRTRSARSIAPPNTVLSALYFTQCSIPARLTVWNTHWLYSVSSNLYYFPHTNTHNTVYNTHWRFLNIKQFILRSTYSQTSYSHTYFTVIQFHMFRILP